MEAWQGPCENTFDFGRIARWLHKGRGFLPFMSPIEKQPAPDSGILAATGSIRRPSDKITPTRPSKAPHQAKDFQLQSFENRAFVEDSETICIRVRNRAGAMRHP
jgi:hypothetical protein